MSNTSFRGRTVVVITASDRCFNGEQPDSSGPAIAQILTSAGAQVVRQVIVSDDLPALAAALKEAAEAATLVVSTGGTGLSPRDNTPEATLSVCSRLVPGLAEMIRQQGRHETPFAALSRGVCGICGSSLIVNLPGSPRGAVSSLHSILNLLPHALDLLAGFTDHDSPR